MNPLHIWTEALSSWIDDVLGTLLWNLSTAGSNKKLGGKFVIASCCPHIFLVRKLIPLWFSKSGGASRPAFAKPRPPSLSWRKAQLFPSLHQPWVWKVHILAAHLVSFSRCSPGDEIFNLCYEMNKVRYKPGRLKYAAGKKMLFTKQYNHQKIIQRLKLLLITADGVINNIPQSNRIWSPQAICTRQVSTPHFRSTIRIHVQKVTVASFAQTFINIMRLKHWFLLCSSHSIKT